MDCLGRSAPVVIGGDKLCQCLKGDRDDVRNETVIPGSALDVAEVAVAVVVLGGVAASWMAIVRGAARHERAELKEHSRATRAHYAAIEAAEDDPSFSPDVIEQSVVEVVALANRLWREEGLRGLDGRPDADFIRTWARSRQSWLGSGLEAKRKPSIDLLRVVNRDDEEEDRVVVRVRLRMHCKYPRLGSLGTHHPRLDERWTLGLSRGRWVLLSVDGDPLAGPVLTAPLVPDRSYDTERLREESLAELADAQKVSDDVALNELVGADEPPALALLDLSVLDGRFLPALIAAEVAHLLEVWEEAVSGSEAAFEELASAEAREALLRPRPGEYLVMRDAVLKSWQPTRLDLSGRPPTIEVMLDVEAVRYVVTDHGKPVAGNETDPRMMALTWILQLTDSTRAPWWLAISNNPAEEIPGWS